MYCTSLPLNVFYKCIKFQQSLHVVTELCSRKGNQREIIQKLSKEQLWALHTAPSLNVFYQCMKLQQCPSYSVWVIGNIKCFACWRRQLAHCSDHNTLTFFFRKTDKLKMCRINKTSHKTLILSLKDMMFNFIFHNCALLVIWRSK